MINNLCPEKINEIKIYADYEIHGIEELLVL